MDEENVKCAHACRNTCAMLSQALRDESDMVRFYEKLKAECDYPDVHDMLQELLEARSRSVLRINQKLNEMRARAEILDGVISSFDCGGCS
jgi:rubrerythrin